MDFITSRPAYSQAPQEDHDSEQDFEKGVSGPPRRWWQGDRVLYYAVTLLVVSNVMLILTDAFLPDKETIGQRLIGHPDGKPEFELIAFNHDWTGLLDIEAAGGKGYRYRDEVWDRAMFPGQYKHQEL
ncbi:hypothetical protein PRZ48_007236 [Zasmidium cellare]|uniref:Uncharacterized protein n=1 Tax=Zasmidium cellare TaxID=395010 RepID=A0ABR0EIS8_ZASCE|nr:hypothetical protein PRZ48_007236 [Zasmidium cellare]